MSTSNWLPEDLHSVAMRLGRADQLAYELSEVALAWSRGPDDSGPLSLRQIERRTGLLDVEVISIRPVPPIAAMLFSEAIHHLRSAIDNVVFYMTAKEHDETLTEAQSRAVSMLIYEDPTKYQEKSKQLVKRGLTGFNTNSTLGKRIASLQPFNDNASVPAIPPSLARMIGGMNSASEHPLILLRDYSNEDKHRTIRLAAGRSLVQRPDDLSRTRDLGMRHVEVGSVLEVVPKGVPTEVETSPALHVQRPNAGVWVGPGYELDCITQHVLDVVLPTLITGLALPGGLPTHIDLSDNGEPLAERLRGAGKERAHDRARDVMTKAYLEAIARDPQFPPITPKPETEV